MKQHAPATERNRDAIRDVLARELPETGTVLEIASGSGQHAAFFAAELPHLFFIPSDVEPAHLESIRAYQADGPANILPPREIDVRSHAWQVGPVDAIFNANMIHISPWAACVGLIDGVRRNLAPGGVLVLYGPFRFEGRHTSESNAQFDDSLRAQNPEWGVRDAEDVIALARTADILFRERVAMPANNYCLIFDRAKSES